MVHPLFGICFALCAGSLQTALSQYVAARQSQGKKALMAALSVSLSLSALLAWLITSFRTPLARYVLLEPRCAPFLPVIALSVPFCALHACINGYYYGMQKTRVPALSQVAEQGIRMVTVWLIVCVWTEKGRPVTVDLAFTAIWPVKWPLLSLPLCVWEHFRPGLKNVLLQASRIFPLCHRLLIRLPPRRNTPLGRNTPFFRYCPLF